MHVCLSFFNSEQPCNSGELIWKQYRSLGFLKSICFINDILSLNTDIQLRTVLINNPWQAVLIYIQSYQKVAVTIKTHCNNGFIAWSSISLRLWIVYQSISFHSPFVLHILMCSILINHLYLKLNLHYQICWRFIDINPFISIKNKILLFLPPSIWH